MTQLFSILYDPTILRCNFVITLDLCPGKSSTHLAVFDAKVNLKRCISLTGVGGIYNYNSDSVMPRILKMLAHLVAKYVQ